MKNRTQSRFDNLQFLRFLAAFAVIFAHVELYEYRSVGMSGGFFALGSFGVDVFFVISGFIMVHVSSKLSANSLAAAAMFFLRRMARVMPMYLLFTLAVVACSYVVSRHTPIDHNFSLLKRFSIEKTHLPYIVESLTFSRWDMQPVFEIGWTLQYEFWFYLLFAGLILSRLNVYLFFSAYAAIIVLAKEYQWSRAGALIVLLDPIMLEFVYGVFLYWIYHNTRRLQESQRFVFALFLTICVCLFMSTDPYCVGALGYYVRPLTWGPAAFAVVYLFLALEGHFKPRPLFVYFGDASYSIYLTHWFVLSWVPFAFWKLGWFPNGSITIYVFASAAVAMIASLAVYRWIEKPANQITSSWLAALSGGSIKARSRRASV